MRIFQLAMSCKPLWRAAGGHGRHAPACLVAASLSPDTCSHTAHNKNLNAMPQVAGARGGRATARRSDDGSVTDPSPTTSGPPSVLRARGALAERAAGADGAGPRLGLGSEHHWAGGPEAAIPSPRDAACVLPPVPSDAAVLPMGSAGFAGYNPNIDPDRSRGRLADSLESIASLDDVPRRRRGFAGRPRAKACASSSSLSLMQCMSAVSVGQQC